MTLWHTLFGFEGRIGRATLWLSAFAVLLLDLSALLAASSAIRSEYLPGGVAHRPDGTALAAGLGLLLTAAASVWAGLALKVKRCHDVGHSGWRLLIGLIPVLGWAWLIVELGFMPGSRRRNRFGPPPDSVEAGPEETKPELARAPSDPAVPSAEASPPPGKTAPAVSHLQVEPQAESGARPAPAQTP